MRQYTSSVGRKRCLPGEDLLLEMPKSSFKIGDKVVWAWGSGEAAGKVSQKFEKRVQRTIEKAKVVRNATPDNPAYLIEQDDGGKVLKSASELRKG